MRNANFTLAHFRCTDSACGWHGAETDLADRVNRSTWQQSKPHADIEACCPSCGGDVTQGAWCLTCGQVPAAPGGDDCEPCFEKHEHQQRLQRAVRLSNELRILREDAKGAPLHVRERHEARAIEIGRELRAITTTTT